MRLWLLVLAVFAALAPLRLAHAQWSRGYNATLPGEGRLKREGDRDFDVNRVRLDLERNGSLTLTIYGSRNVRETIALSGRWTNDKQDVPKVRIARYDGRSADIDGTIEFSHKDGRLERINLSGNAGRDDISLTFRARSTGDGNNGNNDSNNDDNFDRLNVRSRGSGALNIGSDRWQITAVRADLQRGGTARITLSMTGRRDETLSGRWTGRGENIGLNIDEGMNGQLSSLRGSLNRRTRTGGIDKLNLFGQSGRQTVNITFRAD